jgi:hypothetical protein
MFTAPFEPMSPAQASARVVAKKVPATVAAVIAATARNVERI